VGSADAAGDSRGVAPNSTGAGRHATVGVRPDRAGSGAEDDAAAEAEVEDAGNGEGVGGDSESVVAERAGCGAAGDSVLWSSAVVEVMGEPAAVSEGEVVKGVVVALIPEPVTFGTRTALDSLAPTAAGGAAPGALASTAESGRSGSGGGGGGASSI
jgi:hypothetical protein